MRIKDFINMMLANYDDDICVVIYDASGDKLIEDEFRGKFDKCECEGVAEHISITYHEGFAMVVIKEGLSYEK